MRIELVTVDVFTEKRFAGNQLAVFPEAAGLTTAEMQSIAREMHYSETTFVVERTAGRARVRIFTPSQELPFAGHPSLGTAAVLAGFSDGELKLELGVGSVSVQVRAADFGVTAELTAPQAVQVPSALPNQAFWGEMGIRPENVERSLPVQVWSAGNTFAMVPLKSVEDVAAAKVPRAQSSGNWPLGVLVFAPVDRGATHTRVFIPSDPTIPEDPATGSAVVPFAAYLHHHGRLRIGETLTTTQGVEMGRPSRLTVRLERDGDVLRGHLLGAVVQVIRGELQVR